MARNKLVCSVCGAMTLADVAEVGQPWRAEGRRLRYRYTYRCHCSGRLFWSDRAPDAGDVESTMLSSHGVWRRWSEEDEEFAEQWSVAIRDIAPLVPEDNTLQHLRAKAEQLSATGNLRLTQRLEIYADQLADELAESRRKPNIIGNQIAVPTMDGDEVARWTVLDPARWVHNHGVKKAAEAVERSRREADRHDEEAERYGDESGYRRERARTSRAFADALEAELAERAARDAKKSRDSS